jgi:hypothetical protein
MSLADVLDPTVTPCMIRLRRIGETDAESIGIQHHKTLPTLGEVIKVSGQNVDCYARVVQIASANADGYVAIEVDELSPNYIWDTFSVLTQIDAHESHNDVRWSSPPKKPHRALPTTLNLVRKCHELSRHFLERPKPDMKTALSYMRLARRAGWLAFPYIRDEELRRRIVGYKPMSDDEWQELWPSELARND